MKVFCAKIGVTLEMTPRPMPGYKGNLLNLKPCLEQSRTGIVTKIMEAKVLNFAGRHRSGERRADRSCRKGESPSRGGCGGLAQEYLDGVDDAALDAGWSL